MDWPFDGQTLDEKQDLFEEILSWLPPKSLYQFKSVNRTWNRIITSLMEQPRFVRKQVSNAQTQTISRSKTLIFRRGRTSPNCEVVDRDLRITLLTLFPGGQPSHVSTPILPILAESAFDFITRYHCNGILCLLDGSGRLLLWNPVTRQQRLVPNRIMNPDSQAWEQGIGFGCDSGGTEYKIVAMHCVFKGRSDKTPAKWLPGAEVFRLSTNSWTTVRCDEDQMPNNMYWCLSEGVCLHGFCFWLVGCLEAKSVLCFDVLRETFLSLELPRPSPDYFPHSGGFNVRWTVSAWRRCLAVLARYEEKEVREMRHVEAWVMNGVGFWRRCLSLGPFTAAWSPLTLLNRNEVVMVDKDGGIGVYDGGTILRRRLSIDKGHCISCCGLFVETLASVF